MERRRLCAAAAVAALAVLFASGAWSAAGKEKTLHWPDDRGAPRPVVVGRYDTGLVPEASGIAASQRNPGVWWLLDDGRTTSVLAVSPSGKTLSRVQMRGFRGWDNEALAVSPCAPRDPRTCVYVGDIGDNLEWRRTIRVARFVEPDLGDGARERTAAVDVVSLAYPDRAVDAEALLVDEAGTPLIVTKTRDTPRLYGARGFRDGTLIDYGPVPLESPEPPGGRGPRVTAADSRPGRVLLRTYGRAVEYTAPDPASPLSSFPTWPARRVPVATQEQSEAIAYTADGGGWVTIAEGEPELWLVRRPP